jgi:hypothetical protein
MRRVNTIEQLIKRSFMAVARAAYCLRPAADPSTLVVP